MTPERPGPALQLTTLGHQDLLAARAIPGSQPLEWQVPSACSSGRWKTHPRGKRRLVKPGPGTTRMDDSRLDMSATFSDFPDDTVTNVFTDRVATSARLRRPNQCPNRRAMLMTDRSGDLVLDPRCGIGHHGAARAVGSALDHDRHLLASPWPWRGSGSWAQRYRCTSPTPTRREAQFEAECERLPIGPAHQRHSAMVCLRAGSLSPLKSIANNPDIVEGMTREAIDAAIQKLRRVRDPTTSPTRTRARSASPGRSPSSRSARTAVWPSARAGREQTAYQQGPSGRSGAARLGAVRGPPSSRTSAKPASRTVSRASGSSSSRSSPTPGPTSRRWRPRRCAGRQRRGAGSGGPPSIPLKIAIAGAAVRHGEPEFAASAVGEAIAARRHRPVVRPPVRLRRDRGGGDRSRRGDRGDVARGFAEVVQERAFGRIKMLVRMNVDLLMGRDLKKTGSGNLFTVFEPDPWADR